MQLGTNDARKALSNAATVSAPIQSQCSVDEFAAINRIIDTIRDRNIRAAFAADLCVMSEHATRFHYACPETERAISLAEQAGFIKEDPEGSERYCASSPGFALRLTGAVVNRCFNLESQAA